MKLKKAIEIINYYAFIVLKQDENMSKKLLLDDEDINELNDAREAVKEFLEEFK